MLLSCIHAPGLLALVSETQSINAEPNQMIDQKLLSMLRCVISGTPLRPAEPSFVEKMNELIKRGELRDRQDQRISEGLDEGLISETGGLMYPVRNGIVCMVADEAIVLPANLES